MWSGDSRGSALGLSAPVLGPVLPAWLLLQQLSAGPVAPRSLLVTHLIHKWDDPHGYFGSDASLLSRKGETKVRVPAPGCL
jgi:hypothetical protein